MNLALMLGCLSIMLALVLGLVVRSVIEMIRSGAPIVSLHWYRRPATPITQGSGPHDSDNALSSNSDQRVPVLRRRQLLTEDQSAVPPPLPSALNEDERAYRELEVRLEAAFEQYCDGELTLDQYIDRMRSEHDRAIDGANATGSDRATAAIEWCLAWAEEQRGQTPQAA